MITSDWATTRALSAVVGRAGGLGEPLPGVLVDVGGQQAIGRGQPRLDKAMGQRRGHLAGADQSDSLFQHRFTP